MRSVVEVELEACAPLAGPTMVHHNLADHPLLTLDAVTSLASQLPADSVEHNRADVPVVVADGRAPSSALPHETVAREIESGRHWMVLKNIEQIPEYRELLDAVLDALRAGDPALRTNGRRAGFIFVSASDSVTPAHFDPEHNVLLQVRGTKTLHIGSFPDRRHRAIELERYYGGRHRNIDWLPAAAEAFALEPGAGVYLPLYAPHWVESGPGVSISLSATWRPADVLQDEMLYRVNARLRRVGLSPPPPSGSNGDRVKLAFARYERRGQRELTKLRVRARALGDRIRGTVRGS